MSVHRFLHERFASELVCPEVLWDGLIALAPEKACEYTAYRGHFFGYLDDFIGKPTVKFTLLREPTERTISHFLHVQRDGDHPYHHVVSTQTLAEFTTSPVTCHMVVNYQARYLASSGDEVSTARDRLAGEGPRGGWVSRVHNHLETLPLPPAEVLYERARAALEGFVYIGTTERFDDSMRELAQVLDLPPHVPFEAQNVAPADQRNVGIDESTAVLITAATEVDRELYEFARQWRGGPSSR